MQWRCFVDKRSFILRVLEQSTGLAPCRLCSDNQNSETKYPQMELKMEPSYSELCHTNYSEVLAEVPSLGCVLK